MARKRLTFDEEQFERIAESPEVKQAFESKDLESIVAAIKQQALPDPLKQDNWVYRIIVIALGAAVLTAIVGAIMISLRDIMDTATTFKQREVPDVLIALGSAAVGALAGLLVPRPDTDD